MTQGSCGSPWLSARRCLLGWCLSKTNFFTLLLFAKETFSKKQNRRLARSGLTQPGKRTGRRAGSQACRVAPLAAAWPSGLGQRPGARPGFLCVRCPGLALTVTSRTADCEVAGSRVWACPAVTSAVSRCAGRALLSPRVWVGSRPGTPASARPRRRAPAGSWAAALPLGAHPRAVCVP